MIKEALLAAAAILRPKTKATQEELNRLRAQVKSLEEEISNASEVITLKNDVLKACDSVSRAMTEADLNRAIQAAPSQHGAFWAVRASAQERIRLASCLSAHLAAPRYVMTDIGIEHIAPATDKTTNQEEDK